MCLVTFEYVNLFFKDVKKCVKVQSGQTMHALSV